MCAKQFIIHLEKVGKSLGEQCLWKYIRHKSIKLTYQEVVYSNYLKTEILKGAIFIIPVGFYSVVHNGLRGKLCLSRRHLSISGEIVGCHNCRKPYYWHAVGRNHHTVKHPTMHRTDPHNNKLSCPKCQYCQGWETLLSLCKCNQCLYSFNSHLWTIPKSVHLCQLPVLPLQYPGQSTDTSDSQPKPFIFSPCSSSWIVLPFYQCPKLGTPKPSYTHKGTSLSLGHVSQIHPLHSISACAS